MSGLNLKDVRYFNDREVSGMINKTRVTLWRWVNRGDFPKPHYTNSGVKLGWTKQQILDWHENNPQSRE